MVIGDGAWEPGKAEAARANFAAAGLTEFIDLRVGDLRETLKVIEGPIDFALFDIWTEMARPCAVEAIAAASAGQGAVICADNTASQRSKAGYAATTSSSSNDPANGLRTLTLPFEGGFEFTVKIG